MIDQRPHLSPADQAMADIVFRAGNAVEQIAFRAASDVRALPGDPAQRANDALSVFACLATELATKLVVSIVAERGVPLAVAQEVVLLDLNERIRLTVEEAASMMATVQ